MGCFLACFGGPKDRRRRKPVSRIPSREGAKLPKHRRLMQPSSPRKPPQLLGSPPLKPTQPPQLLPAEAVVPGSHLELRGTAEEWRPALKQLPEEKPPSPHLELSDTGEKSSFNSPKKKVTFDLNVKTYEQPPAHNDEIYSSQEVAGEEKKIEEEKLQEECSSTPLFRVACTLNHRYQNCVNGDDEVVAEDEEDNYDYTDDDDDEGDGDDDSKDAMNDKGYEEEESYDSYFSLPLEKERQAFKEVSSAAKPIACSSPDRQLAFMAGQAARDRTQFVHSVLNPVENIMQWKEVKSKAQPLKHPKKENINVEQGSEIPFSFVPTFKLPKSERTFDSTPSPNNTKHEVSVDASLSNWLPSSEITPIEGSKGNSSCRTNSSVSLDDRPILGALTMEDLKKHSVSSSSPRRSPSRSPDEIPILGTVGSYWSCTKGDTDSGSSQKSISDNKGIPNTTSKYREDKTVNWHSTPFQVRLERAWNIGDAEAYSS